MDGKNRRLQGLVHWRKWHCPRHSQIKMANGYHSEIHTIIRMRVYISSNQAQDFAWLGNVGLKHVELYSVPTGIFQAIFVLRKNSVRCRERTFTDSIVLTQTREIFNSLFCFCKDKFSHSLKSPFKPFFAWKTRVDRAQWENL